MATEFMTMKACVKRIGTAKLRLVKMYEETTTTVDGKTTKERVDTGWLKCWCDDTKPAPTMVLIPANLAKAVALADKAGTPLSDLFIRNSTCVAQESGDSYTKTLILRPDEAEYEFTAD
jgi:hypothetical protein